jgi:hypothetical protein
MEWVLILFIHAGAWAQGDSVALTTVPMESEKACRLAGEAAKPLVSGTTKNTRYICVRNK